MLNFNINLTSLAVILWSGMLIISGSIWVLSSQVRKLADLLEDRSRTTAPVSGTFVEMRPSSPAGRVARRNATARVRAVVRTNVGVTRTRNQLQAPRRSVSELNRLAVSEASSDASKA